MRPSGVIFAHNHPSGNCQPSLQDDASLRELGEMCALHGVMLQDSIIFSDGKMYSYYQEDPPQSAAALRAAPKKFQEFHS